MAHRRDFVSGLTALTFTAAVLVACGGSAGSDLFGGASGDDGGAAGDTGQGTSEPDAATLADATTPPTPDASQRDAAPPPTKDASVPDTFVPPTDPGIQCGTTECDPASALCCRFGTPPNDSSTCVSPAGCQSVAALPIACDDAADCDAAGHPGQICCATLNAQTGRAQEVRCRSAQSCNGSDQVVVCDAATTGPCPNGGTCRPSATSLPGYDICL
jgi:hypothetical protein